jgi:hypothetical protein
MLLLPLRFNSRRGLTSEREEREEDSDVDDFDLPPADML